MKNQSIFYYKNIFETDFVVFEKNRINRIIQVCYQLYDSKTLEREKRGLVEACLNLKKKEGLIINEYVEKEETTDGIKISYVPLWKWLLEK